MCGKGNKYKLTREDNTVSGISWFTALVPYNRECPQKAKQTGGGKRDK
jgi:hypothetical protein